MSQPQSQGLTDEEVANKMVHVIASAPDGQLLGALQIARGIGLPFSQKEQDKSRSRVHRATNRAVDLTGELYPGRALSVDRSGTWGTYRMVDDVDERTFAAEKTRLRQAETKIDRVHRVTSVAKAGSVGRMLHDFTGGMLQMFAVVDRINMPAEEAKEEVGADT
jgi:hypothetical protein